MAIEALAALLHLLVFAYWLGGDIGVFYASFLVSDPKQAAPARAAAGKILADVDMVPRLALVFSLPTGLFYAAAKGWVSIGPLALLLAFAAAAAWAALLVRLHAAHGGTALRRIDSALRLGFIAGLAGTAAAGLAGAISLPAFLALKMLLLAFAAMMGVLIRATLTPFGPAFVKIASGSGDQAADRAVAASLAAARPLVVLIWLSLVAAAFLGALAGPVRLSW